jgi:hypothetical protein
MNWRELLSCAPKKLQDKQAEMSADEVGRAGGLT